MLDLSYPSWYLIGCAILSAALSYFLYYFRDTSFSRIWKIPLSIVRFTVAFLLCVLLLKPILKYATVSYDKPIIILGIDNSESMLLNNDSATFQLELSKKIEEMKMALSSDFEWKTLFIGNEIESNSELNFKENSTDLSAFTNHVNNFYTYDNVAAAILISDGIFNKGANPSFQKWKINAPLYTVAIGDSSKIQDQKIIGVRNNSITFLGNKFPVKIDVGVEGYKKHKSILKVFGYGKELYSKEIEITNQNFYSEIQLLLEAKKVGIQKFTVRIIPAKGEANTVNNEQIIYVEVKDKRQKILMVYDFAHPDVAAIRKSLELEDSYEVKVIKSKEFVKLKKENIEENYNLVVAFQLPMYSQESKQAFQLLQECATPQWYMASSKTDHLTLFNSDNGIQWNGQANKTNTVQGKINSNFSLFTINKDLDVENGFPPVKVPFGVLKYAAGSQVLSFQSVGGIQTDYPLWLFTANEFGKRRAYFFGEGIWRWKMSEYEQKNNQELFDELVIKTVQYLASKKDISRFRVFSKTSFYENDPIEWNAEFYNLSYELINDPSVKIKVSNESGEDYDLEMNREGNKYYLNMGKLSPGKYSFHAFVNHKGKEFKKSGEFSVKKLDMEYKNLRADFNLMQNLASKNGGEFYTFNQWNKMVEKLKEIKEVKRSFEEIEIKDLIHQKWLFVLLIVFIGIEWLIRKREGVI